MSPRPGRNCTVIEIVGDLDLATAPQLRDVLRQAADQGAMEVVVDLDGVGFLDSSALGALIFMFKMLRDRGGRLSVAASRPAVRSVFALTYVDRAMDVYDTVQAAEDSARKPPEHARGRQAG
jgi:anti-sigma B factor antagonist